MNILITGATGFIGGYLSRLLAQAGHTIHGTYYSKKELSKVNLPKNINLIRCDIRNKKEVENTINLVRPDQIYHLAAQSFAPLSWKKPDLTIKTNVNGTINIFESLLKYNLKPRVLVACSSAEYGFIDETKLPINEDHPLRPVHPYGISKVAQELLAYQYFINFQIPTVSIRLFNTTGPGPIHDVCSDFSRRIAEAEAGIIKPIIKVGNLDTKRDFNDVRDAIQALCLSQDKGRAGEVYNLCTGKSYSGSDILNMLISMARIKLSVETNSDLLRPSDEPIFIGDSTKLQKETGWSPSISMENTLKDMLDYWRNVYS